MNAMKIAIVRLSALGDIVFSMVVLQFIKQMKPDCVIDWYCDSAFVPLLICNNDIDEVVGLDIKALKNSFSFGLLRQNLQKLHQKNYDLVIDMQGLLKSAVVARALGSNCAGFDKNSTREALAAGFYAQKIPSPYEKNVVLRYCDLVKGALGVDITLEDLQSYKPFIFCSGSSFERSSNGKKRVLIAPGASKEYKKYPKEKFAQIAKELDVDIFICHSGDAELADAEWIAQNSAAKVLPKMSLEELKCQIASSDLVIGADSGVTHIAFGMKIPSIALFGATPAYRNAYETDINKTISSSSKVDAKKIDKNDFSVANIDPSVATQLARSLLER
jgi:heptosyltransferase I